MKITKRAKEIIRLVRMVDKSVSDPVINTKMIEELVQDQLNKLFIYAKSHRGWSKYNTDD